MTGNQSERPNIPLVSVIMPTYNDRLAIEESVNSILSQSLTSWELIIVDDASTDGTAEVVETRFDDPRITLIRMETNSGSGYCRNRAIGVARGEFIAVMDADDISMPERLQLQVDRMQAAPDLAAVSAQVLEFGTWGGPILGSWPTKATEIAARQKALKMPIPHPATMFRKDILVAAGSYDIECRRAQDYSLFLGLSEAKLETLESPLVMYRTERPISLRYVLRNEQYADLARLRSRLRSQGVTTNDLPKEPQFNLRLVVKALRSWAIRNGREQWALLRARLSQRKAALRG